MSQLHFLISNQNLIKEPALYFSGCPKTIQKRNWMSRDKVSKKHVSMLIGRFIQDFYK